MLTVELDTIGAEDQAAAYLARVDNLRRDQAWVASAVRFIRDEQEPAPKPVRAAGLPGRLELRSTTKPAGKGPKRCGCGCGAWNGKTGAPHVPSSRNTKPILRGTPAYARALERLAKTAGKVDVYGEPALVGFSGF